MKQLLIGLLAVLAACGSQQHDTQMANTTQVSTDSAAQKTPAETGKTDTALVSNEPVIDNSNSNQLKQLADKNVFSTLHSKLIPTLPGNLQEVFKNSPHLVLLTYSKGNLFLNDKEDYAFVVYNKQNAGIMVLVYDAMANAINALYSDIKVENELKSLSCNSVINELTRDIEYTIIEQNETLIKDPAKYLESPTIRITDISKDRDIMLKDGCLSKRSTKADLKNALCIATSTVYNNWACVRYDKEKKLFVVFYSQAFAD